MICAIIMSAIVLLMRKFQIIVRMLVKGGEKMKLKVSVFEYLNQKVMYVQDVNYYFGIKNDFNIKLGIMNLVKIRF